MLPWHRKGSSSSYRMVRSPPVLYIISLTYPAFPLSELQHLTNRGDDHAPLMAQLEVQMPLKAIALIRN